MCVTDGEEVCMCVCMCVCVCLCVFKCVCMTNGEEWEKEAPRLIEEMRKVRSAG